MLNSALVPVRKMIHGAVRLAAITAPNQWTGIPRPATHAFVHGPGANPLKLLLFGGGPSIGYGVVDHELALGGHFARALARSLGRGVDLEVRIQKELGAVDTQRLATIMRTTSYDAILVTVGVQDAVYLDSDGEWASQTDALVRALQGDAQTPVFFVALPRFSDMVDVGRVTGRILDRRVERMNDRLRELSSTTDAVHYTEFVRSLHRNDLTRDAVPTYREWAEAMVDVVGLDLDRLPTSPCGTIDEESRQSAVDRLRLLDTPAEQRFDRITALAQSYFHSKGAAISLIDRDRQWYKSRQGFDVIELPRAEAFCDYTIRGDREFVVTDARLDPRFSAFPSVEGELGVRSYAGWPIDSPSGQHVGALCVFDTVPRTFSDSDLAFLRNLAMLAQNELARAAA